MSDKQVESCGRCAMSTVVDTATDGEEVDRNPFGDERIKVEESELRRIAPGAWMGRLTATLDRIVQRLTYGR